MMSRRIYYPLLLLLPLILPLPCFLFQKNLFTAFLIGSLFLGGWQYIIFALVSFACMFGKTTKQWELFFWVAPVLFLPLACLGIAVVTGPPVISADHLFYYSLFVLTFGYGYVLLVKGLTFALNTCNLLKE